MARPSRPAPPAAPAGIAPRRAALALLSAVIGEGRTLAEAMPAALSALDPADRARAQRLATQTLRDLGRADRLLAPSLTRMPPLAVRNILRLGAVELAHGAASHGVVNDLVEIAGRGKRTRPLKGLVNAVLRKIAPEAEAAWIDLPPQRLPKWLRGPLVEAWGRAEIARIEAVHGAVPPLDLTLREPGGPLAASLGGEELPTGSLRLVDAGQVSALPGYGTGGFWVQDAAAALPARLLAPRAGERVIDLCAAPGGKTLQLAAAGARVTALDLSEARLGRLRENLARTGLEAEVIAGDALIHEGRYDAVLLDAPCSATGTIRRHPDLPFARDGAGISELIALQARMIDHALTLLPPGGRMVFCTCSLIPDEGEVQVEEALARHPGLEVVPPGADWVDPAWRSSEGGLRILPSHWADRGGIDGFYMALLRKPG
ncbi:RsmB/NOP family class I SAM-dependent RNA methyltransferase [Wenxinia saemankumensis]|uniref:16S rRNA (Cytosine967-C5)-methyltransferase n=1 Tax=Wenxinia saemankumensis TaxID=1447782 RepID=A0A1M6EBK7_9RHOB|nr:transcription antitermination factor NusB [Wenxinia saemankumensis]SHI82897.1 16S rRNA (cytosine967-C5)-methyltransferase [Wenxinia saemankumensis]